MEALDPAILKAHEFSKVIRDAKKKIYAVVIIGLSSGERIMKDVFSEENLKDEINAFVNLKNYPDKWFRLFGAYYFNGQKHILVDSIDVNSFETISYTKIDYMN